MIVLHHYLDFVFAHVFVPLFVFVFTVVFVFTWTFSPLPAIWNFFTSSSSNPKVWIAGRMRVLNKFFNQIENITIFSLVTVHCHHNHHNHNLLDGWQDPISEVKYLTIESVLNELK